jgi:hypothetical protein
MINIIHKENSPKSESESYSNKESENREAQAQEKLTLTLTEEIEKIKNLAKAQNITIKYLPKVKYIN